MLNIKRRVKGMKHTQGKWEITEQKDVKFGGKEYYIETKKPITLVATAYKEANAHLIASAPELLEACKKLLTVVKKFGIREPNNMTQGLEAIQDSERAIAKATGDKND